jgi:hypothetical protein
VVTTSIIQDIPGGKVGILGGHSIGHSKQKSVCVHVSYSERFPRELFPCTIHCTLYRRASRHVLTYLLTYGAQPFLRSCQLSSHSRTSQHFLEPAGSLPCPQELSTGPYPEPDRSSPYNPILSKIYFNIVHPLTSWSC